MAYAATISLKQTINGLLNSSHISFDSTTRKILEVAYKATSSLQKGLEILNDSRGRRSERLDDLDGQIRDCVHHLEDVLEFYESNDVELAEVRQEMISFADRVGKVAVEYVQELFSPNRSNPEDDDDVSVSSNNDFGVEMVGRALEFNQTREYLLRRKRPDDMCVISLVGESGTGRSIAAQSIFEELCKGEQKSFDCGAWVKIGTEYQLKEVLMRILAQIDTSAGDYESLISQEDEEICDHLYKILDNRRYMIVLDDIREMQVLDFLRKSLPDQSNGSIVILTTSVKELAQSASLHIFEVPALFFGEISWFILSDAMFRDRNSIPLELEEAGRKIAENCRGRSISLAKTVLFLSKTEKTAEQWRKIAADKENPIFMFEDEISEIHEIKAQMQSYNWISEVDAIKTQWVSKLIDPSDYISNLKRKMYPKSLFTRMETICFVGMAGIGKSTFVKKVFEDNLISCNFDHSVWINLGPQYQADEILIDILAQINPNIGKLHMKADDKLTKDMCAQLSDKRCLIVLDDLWSKEPLHNLKKLFPDIRGRALVTTRQEKVAEIGEDDINFEIRLLNEEESWCLFRQKVFAVGLCSFQLEKVGRIIAKNCEGLPLLILKVANQLLKVEKTLEYWNIVASEKDNSVFRNAYDEISSALLPSYKSLPQHLKACFLYMGIFRRRYEISSSKLTNLLIAEGFLEPNLSGIIEEFVPECLTELLYRNLVMVQYKDSNYENKRYHLHSVFWHLSNSEAVKHKVFYPMNSYADCSIECLENQRRLCIRNCILLGMKDVHKSMASNTNTHSLLCVSPPHKYPVPISFDMRLLRVMNALTIRLYEFPIEVVKLIHLRYLGLTCDGNLPTSISNLLKLQFLIVSRYMNTNSTENSLPLPMEIWDMKELKHLQIMGGCLPNPKCGTGLPKLSTLLDVIAQSCTEKVLKMIPNLKRLGIRIELAPDGEGNPFHCLNSISCLLRLVSLKCVVLNPEIVYEVVSPYVPISMFPSNLKRLNLSGFGFPWEYMIIIGRLKNLEVLKLKHYAFQGPKWEVNSSGPFTKLKFLLLEDTNLVNWEFQSPAMPRLERLSIKHCYELEDLPTHLPSLYVKEIEIVDCNPLTLSWAKQMRERRPMGFRIQPQLSWIAHKEDSHLHL